MLTQLVDELRYKSEGRGSSLHVIEFIQLTKSFQSHYGPGVDSSYNRNEYQESSCG
jgi:hypothetical protein